MVMPTELVDDTFAEAFPMLMSRVLITADSQEWAMVAAEAATGFASSIIMSPAEAGIEGMAPSSDTPDGRPGVYIQIFQRFGHLLKAQLISRISQCVLTCPTACAFNGLNDAKKWIRVGSAISLFGDGFEQRSQLQGRIVWKVPVMEGEFIVEERIGVKRGIAGGNFLIISSDRESGLTAAQAAVKAMATTKGVILPFPGGICRSGSKVGSNKYKLRASTNHRFCPDLRSRIPDSALPEGATCVYEIVCNGLNLDVVRDAMSKGIMAVLSYANILKVSAVNFGGKLGPYRIPLRELL